MKNELVTFSAALAALFATAALAAAGDFAGKWVGKAGDADITIELAVDGDKVTGTLTNSVSTGAAALQEAKIKNDEVSFFIMRTINDAETKVTWTGKLAGDEIKFTRGAAGGTQATEVVAKRAKPE